MRFLYKKMPLIFSDEVSMKALVACLTNAGIGLRFDLICSPESRREE